MNANEVITGNRLWSVEQSDCIDWLRSLPADSLDLIFTSPPYELARTYLENGKNLGIARKTEAWVAWLIEVITECSRVCKGLIAFVVEGQTRNYRYSAGPFLLMADLHRAGFNLRKPCVYRRDGIPGGGGQKGQHEENGGGADWLKNNWEPIICITRPGKLPWADGTACGTIPKFGPGGACSHRLSSGQRINQWGKTGTDTGTGTKERVGARAKRPSHQTMTKRDMARANGIKMGKTTNGITADGFTSTEATYLPPVIANPGNVIDCRTGGGHMGHALAHDNEAPFPVELAAFFVRSFCPPGGIVADPFCGSGSTLQAAIENDRRGIGCDLRESQVKLTTKRLLGVTPAIPGMG